MVTCSCGKKRRKVYCVKRKGTKALEYQVEQLHPVLNDCCVHTCFLSIIVDLAGKSKVEKYVALCANERRHLRIKQENAFLLNVRDGFINLSLLLY